MAAAPLSTLSCCSTGAGSCSQPAVRTWGATHPAVARTRTVAFAAEETSSDGPEAPDPAPVLDRHVGGAAATPHAGDGCAWALPTALPHAAADAAPPPEPEELNGPTACWLCCEVRALAAWPRARRFNACRELQFEQSRFLRFGDSSSMTCDKRVTQSQDNKHEGNVHDLW